MASQRPGVQCQQTNPVNVQDGTLACTPMPAPVGAHIPTKKHRAHHVDRLKAAFEQARKLGWLVFFQEAALANKFPPELLLGIAYRESAINPNALGEDGHGRGLMQIDNRFHKSWFTTANWRNPHANINMGASVLKGLQDEIRAGQKKSLTVNEAGKAHTFVGKEINEKDLLAVAVAAYNCGLWAYYHYSRGDDIDKGTTGKNYSKAVFKNAERFRRLLQAPTGHVNVGNR